MTWTEDIQEDIKEINQYAERECTHCKKTRCTHCIWFKITSMTNNVINYINHIELTETN